MNCKYKEKDIIKIIRNEASIKDIAKKYGVQVNTVRMVMYRFGYRMRKGVKISSPFQNDVYVDNVQKCADELGLSRPTIYKALNGKKVKILERMKIKIEYAEEDKYE